MKKTLIALAAVAAATGAMAQATISGTIDVGYQKSDENVTAASLTKDGKFVRNGNATSVIRFSATEDLGGGLSAQGYYEINPNPVSTDIGNSQSYVGLSGSFGTIRLGKPNTGLLSTQGARTPYGTALGSEYGVMSIANTRNNGALQYRSPAISGFTAVIDYLPIGSVTKLETAKSPVAAFMGAEIATNDKAATIVTISGDVAGAKLAYSRSSNVHAGIKSQNDFSAQYSINALTVYYGYSKTKGGEATQNLAAKFNMGAIDLTANYARNSDAGTATTVGAAYNLSKRTTAYVKYNMVDADKLSTPVKVNTTLVGLQHNF